MHNVKMPTHCAICNKKFNYWKFWWEIEKRFLRITEISYLWENCCSNKCYGILLERMMEELKNNHSSVRSGKEKE